VKAAKIWQ